MEMAVREIARARLEERRARLRDARSVHPGDVDVEGLLGQVDEALARLDTPTFGTCLICEEHVSDRDLSSNPLLEYCLCDLTPSQQRSLEHDLSLARRLQAALLPDPDLRRAGWAAHHRYEPAGVVSGDYCDLWTPEDAGEAIVFAVADVAGKGVAASLLMTHLQAAFRSLMSAGVRLTDLVARVNQQLLDASLPAQYATMACGRATTDGRIELVNAGHCPPLVLRGGEVEVLDPTGLPVGMVADRPYEVTELRLEPGDALVLHTDGLTEAEAPGGARYEIDRLRAALERYGTGAAAGAMSARALVHALRTDLTSFLGGGEPQDDLTLLGLVREGAGG